MLKPGGILCLIDLDHNCLNHYGIPPKLESAINGVIASLEKKTAFDAYAGKGKMPESVNLLIDKLRAAGTTQSVPQVSKPDHLDAISNGEFSIG